eukprot:1635203-Pleurochrysis_carterae.AAC.6
MWPRVPRAWRAPTRSRAGSWFCSPERCRLHPAGAHGLHVLSLRVTDGYGRLQLRVDDGALVYGRDVRLSTPALLDLRRCRVPQGVAEVGGSANAPTFAAEAISIQADQRR